MCLYFLSYSHLSPTLTLLPLQVLFDTLIKQTTQEEVVAILGHELGHWKMNHLPKSLFVAELHTFTTFYVFSLVINNPELYTAFGRWLKT